VYLFYRFSLDYSNRDFSLTERLMTESRVIWFYARSVLIPDIRQLALFHDDILVSRSLLDPPTTFISSLALAVTLATAILAREKAPVLAFGVLFFLSTHLLESTVLPLELVHEHRNYIGSWALLLPPTYYFFRYGYQLGRPVATALLAGALLVSLGSATRVRAIYWGDELILAQYQAHHHPESIRTLLGAGAAFSSRPNAEKTADYADRGLEYYLKAFQLDPAESKALISIISILFRQGDLKSLQTYVDHLEMNLRTRKISTDTANAFIVTGRCLAGPDCMIPRSLYQSMVESLLLNPDLTRNKDFASKVYAAKSNLTYLNGDIDAAIRYGARAIELFPDEPQLYLNQAFLMISSGQFHAADRYLKQALAIDDTRFVRKRVSSLALKLKQHQQPTGGPIGPQTPSEESP
jgi:tetratricopeptide (TPR) repeat protein